MTKDEAVQQAIDFLDGSYEAHAVRKALQYALAQPAKCITKDCTNHKNQGTFVSDLCAPCWDYIVNGEGVHSQAYRNAQLNKKWIGLSDDEIAGLELDSLIDNSADWDDEPKPFARLIEQALKEKNHATNI